jgi:uncharacterized cupin superfamily protein
MVFKLKEKCEESKKKEIFYGSMLNNAIKDVYMGMGYLDPGESREEGPGKRHEEIIYALDGEINIKSEEDEFVLHEGEAYHIPDGYKVMASNAGSERVYFIVAGGHPKHSHHHH